MPEKTGHRSNDEPRFPACREHADTAMKRWIFRDAPPGAPNAAWAEDLGISPTLLNLLWQRGFDTRDDMDAFLSARLHEKICDRRL